MSKHIKRFFKVMFVIFLFFFGLFIFLYVRSLNIVSSTINRLRYSNNIEWKINTEAKPNNGFINDYDILKLEVAYTAKNTVLLTYCSTNVCGYNIIDGSKLYEIPITEKEGFHVSTDVNEDIFFIRTRTSMIAYEGATGEKVWEKAYNDKALPSYFSTFNTDVMAKSNNILVTVRDEPMKTEYFVPLIETFNVYTGQLLWTASPASRSFAGFHFDVFDNYAVAGTDLNTIEIYDLNTGTLLHTVNVPNSEELLPFAKVGDALLFRTGVNSLKGIVAVNATNGEIIWSKVFASENHDNNVEAVCINNSDVLTVLTGTQMRTASLYRLSIIDGSPLLKIELPKYSEALECNGSRNVVISSRFADKSGRAQILYLIDEEGEILNTKEFTEPISRYAQAGGHMYLVSQDGRLYDYDSQT